jgi:altronate dehydratase small subunit
MPSGKVARVGKPKKMILMHERDNVATAIRDLQSSTEVSIENEHERFRFKLIQSIPFGHKFCVRRIPVGGDVVKYGEVIGVATANISPGEHVHVHNVKSERGR